MNACEDESEPLGEWSELPRITATVQLAADRTITTVEQLDALPVYAIVVHNDCRVFRKMRLCRADRWGWHQLDSGDVRAIDLPLPIRVIYPEAGA